MRHLMNPLDFSVEELDNLFDLANDIEKNPAKYAEKCKGKKLATCFYEPSTRTRLSFEAAMINLGKRHWFFRCQFILCFQGRKRLRYDPRYFLFCGYLCDAPPQGRRCHGRSLPFLHSRDQCR